MLQTTFYVQHAHTCKEEEKEKTDQRENVDYAKKINQENTELVAQRVSQMYTTIVDLSNERFNV